MVSPPYAVPTLTALIAFLRKLQRARAEDDVDLAPDPTGQRTPTHRSP